MAEELKFKVGSIQALAGPHNFVIGEVTANVVDEIDGREVSHNLTLKVRVPYRSDATLSELQAALRAKALETLDAIGAANR